MKTDPYTVVFENLVNAETGTPASRDIMYSFVRDPRSIFYVVGLPAVGKTTALSQFVKTLQNTADNYKVDITIKTVFFDKVQNKVEKNLAKQNPKKQDSTKWDKKDWDTFGKELEKNIIKPDTYKRAKFNKIRSSFLTIETPFMFYWEKEDNGHKILKNIIKKNPNFIVVFLVADEDVVKKTLAVRSQILTMPLDGKESIAKKLEREYKVVIRDLKNDSISDKKIREIIKRMASRQAVEQVKRKWDSKITEWTKNKPVYGKYQKLVTLPEPYKKLSPKLRRTYTTKAAYALFILREKYNLPKDRSIVVFNPHLPFKKTYINLSMLEI